MLPNQTTINLSHYTLTEDQLDGFLAEYYGKVLSVDQGGVAEYEVEFLDIYASDDSSRKILDGARAMKECLVALECFRHPKSKKSNKIE